MMDLKVERNITWNNEEFTGYEIIGSEWIFKTNTLYILTEYHLKKHGKNIKRLVRHPFKVGVDIVVDELIKQVHNYHK
jgi:hypothetical protein